MTDKSLAQDALDPDEPLDRLVILVAELSPFLDSQGRAYCYVKSNTSDNQPLIGLDSEVAFSVLSYGYFVKYKQFPARSKINQARSLARGKLWVELPPQGTFNRKWAATIKAISKALLSKGDFLGSAAAARNLLNNISRSEPEICSDLPRSDDEMGIVLSRIGLLLRSHNIELFRPPRRDKERLWCWRLLTPGHDTSDTLVTYPSQASGSSDDGKNHENPQNDASDTYSDQLQTLSQLSQGVLN
jgi:hypothetical protein